LAVNGEPVTALVNRTAKWVSVSNRPTLRYYFSDYLKNLVWQSDKKVFQLIVTRNGVESNKVVEFIHNRDAANVARLTDYLNNAAPD
ncbi:hypothetical protein O6382_24655, partial [Salmonella enterica subsp. enterica]